MGMPPVRVRVSNGHVPCLTIVRGATRRVDIPYVSGFVLMSRCATRQLLSCAMHNSLAANNKTAKLREVSAQDVHVFE